MAAHWDPRRVLNIYPEDGESKCVGTTVRGNRCCNIMGNAVTRNEASTILNNLSHPSQFRRNQAYLLETLQRLAACTLCSILHRGNKTKAGSQVEPVARRWLDILLAFADGRSSRASSGSRYSSQTNSVSDRSYLYSLFEQALRSAPNLRNMHPIYAYPSPPTTRSSTPSSSSSSSFASTNSSPPWSSYGGSQGSPLSPPSSPPSSYSMPSGPSTPSSSSRSPSSRYHSSPSPNLKITVNVSVNLEYVRNRRIIALDTPSVSLAPSPPPSPPGSRRSSTTSSGTRSTMSSSTSQTPSSFRRSQAPTPSTVSRYTAPSSASRGVSRGVNQSNGSSRMYSGHSSPRQVNNSRSPVIYTPNSSAAPTRLPSPVRNTDIVPYAPLVARLVQVLQPTSPPSVGTAIQRAEPTSPTVATSPGLVRRQPIHENPCYACYEYMNRDEDAEWCQLCGQNVCLDCFDAWNAEMALQKRPITCGFCRGPLVI